MWSKGSCWVSVLLVGLLYETTRAQEERHVSIRVVPGLSIVRSFFGDDSPRGTTKVGNHRRAVVRQQICWQSAGN